MEIEEDGGEEEEEATEHTSRGGDNFRYSAIRPEPNRRRSISSPPYIELKTLTQLGALPSNSTGALNLLSDLS